MRLVSGLALAVVAAVALLACGETQEVIQSESPGATTPAASATPTAGPVAADTPTATAAPDVSPTPTVPLDVDPYDPSAWTAVPVPTSAIPAVPESWEVFDSKGGVSYQFRYPDTWFIGGTNRVMSFDPATWTTPAYPPGGVLVEVQIGPVQSAAERPPEATDTTIAGMAAWEIVRVLDLPGVNPDISRYHSVGVDYSGYRIFIVGFFEDKDADESAFRQIVSSFEFLQPAQ